MLKYGLIKKHFLLQLSKMDVLIFLTKCLEFMRATLSAKALKISNLTDGFLLQLWNFLGH